MQKDITQGFVSSDYSFDKELIKGLQGVEDVNNNENVLHYSKLNKEDKIKSFDVSSPIAKVNGGKIVRMNLTGLVGTLEYNDGYLSGFTIDSFADALSIYPLNSGDTLEITLNSIGGSHYQGIMIYEMIRNLRRNGITVNIFYVVALSAAAYIAMAGTGLPICSISGIFMIHDVRIGTFGNAQEHRDDAVVLDQASEAGAGLFATKNALLSQEEILALMRAETRYNQIEAIAAGWAVADTRNLENEDSMTSSDSNVHVSTDKKDLSSLVDAYQSRVNLI